MLSEQRLLGHVRLQWRYSLLLMILLGAPALAQSVGNAGAGTSSSSGASISGQNGASKANLDLSSTKNTVSASRIKGLTQATINVGGSKLTVTQSSQLTPAEAMAVRQVIHSGQQSLVLGQLGNASGGTVQINKTLNSLQVPSGVTVLTNAARGTLANMTGTLNNAGTIIEYSNSTSLQTAVISAANVINQRGGLISTLQQNISNNLLASTGHLNLSISSLNDILNYGTISSAGALNLSAGGSIINALPPGISGPSPLIQSLGTLTLNSQAGKIVNSGLINSLTGNLNILTQATNNLTVINAGGRMQALAGVINLRDQSTVMGKVLTNISGGTLLAQAINIYSGTGSAGVNVGELHGPINIYAGDAQVSTASGQLEIGTMKLSGDPTFYNTNGNVVINSDLTFSGQNLAIVASGDITTAAGAAAIDTSSLTGNGGAITLIAGANFTTNGPDPVLPPPPGDTTSTLTLLGASSTGGQIDLNSGTPITALQSFSGKANGSGGTISLFAFKGTAASSGSVITPPAVSILSGGNGTGSNGDLLIFAGARNNALGISIGPVNTSGGKATTGPVYLYSVQPAVQGTVQILNGKMQGSGNINGNDATREGQIIVAGGISSSSAVSISTNGDLSVAGDINTSATGAGSAGAIYASGNKVNLQNVIADGHAGARPGSIYVYANNKLSSGYFSASSDSAKDGGSIDLNATGFKINGKDAGGFSINVSSLNGSGGSLHLKDYSLKRFDVGSLASGNGTLGSITADGFINGGHLAITCCGNLAIFTPATITASGTTGIQGDITIKNCDNKPINPEIIVKRADKPKTVKKHTAKKSDPTKAPTDLTFSAPGSDDPDDIPDIGETDEQAKIPADDKLIRGAIVRRYMDNIDEIKQLSAQGLLIDHNRQDTAFDIDKGNVLLLPDKPMQVGFQMGGKLQMAAGSAVFVIDKGDDLEILDFHDAGPGSVKVFSGDRIIKLSPGKVLLLTKKDLKEYKQASLTPKVGYRNPKMDVLSQGVRAFAADFSIPSGLLSIVPLRDFIMKASGADRQMLGKILKNSAIIGDVTPYAGPYVSGLQ